MRADGSGYKNPNKLGDCFFSSKDFATFPVELQKMIDTSSLNKALYRKDTPLDLTLYFIVLEINNKDITYGNLKKLPLETQELICNGFSLVDQFSKVLSPMQQQYLKQEIAKCTTSDAINKITSLLQSSSSDIESFHQALEDLNKYSLGKDDLLVTQIKSYQDNIDFLKSENADELSRKLGDILQEINGLKSSVNSTDMQVLKNYLKKLYKKGSIFHSSGQIKASAILEKLKAVPLEQRKDILNSSDANEVKAVQTEVSKERLRFKFSSKEPNNDQIKQKLGKLKAQDKSHDPKPSNP